MHHTNKQKENRGLARILSSIKPGRSVVVDKSTTLANLSYSESVGWGMVGAIEAVIRTAKITDPALADSLAVELETAKKTADRISLLRRIACSQKTG